MLVVAIVIFLLSLLFFGLVAIYALCGKRPRWHTRHQKMIRIGMMAMVFNIIAFILACIN